MKTGARISVVVYEFTMAGLTAEVRRARVVAQFANSLDYRCETRGHFRGYVMRDEKGLSWAPGWGGKKVRALHAARALA